MRLPNNPRVFVSSSLTWPSKLLIDQYRTLTCLLSERALAWRDGITGGEWIYLGQLRGGSCSDRARVGLIESDRDHLRTKVLYKTSTFAVDRSFVLNFVTQFL